MKTTLICGLGAAGLVLAGCETIDTMTPTERAAAGGLAGAAVGAAVGENLTGALVGGAAGAALGYYTAPKTGDRVNRRQYWDSQARRYYFYDPVSRRYYWENGEPRS